MIGIIGKKLGMTQVFNDRGEQIPVTVVEAPPNPVTKVMDKAVAGFAAVEVGYGQQRTAQQRGIDLPGRRALILATLAPGHGQHARGDAGGGEDERQQNGLGQRIERRRHADETEDQDQPGIGRDGLPPQGFRAAARAAHRFGAPGVAQPIAQP